MKQVLREVLETPFAVSEQAELPGECCGGTSSGRGLLGLSVRGAQGDVGIPESLPSAEQALLLKSCPVAIEINWLQLSGLHLPWKTAKVLLGPEERSPALWLFRGGGDMDVTPTVCQQTRTNGRQSITTCNSVV